MPNSKTQSPKQPEQGGNSNPKLQISFSPGLPQIVYADDIAAVGVGPEVSRVTFGVEAGSTVKQTTVTLVIPTRVPANLVGDLSRAFKKEDFLQKLKSDSDKLWTAIESIPSLTYQHTRRISPAPELGFSLSGGSPALARVRGVLRLCRRLHTARLNRLQASRLERQEGQAQALASL